MDHYLTKSSAQWTDDKNIWNNEIVSTNISWNLIPPILYVIFHDNKSHYMKYWLIATTFLKGLSCFKIHLSLKSWNPVLFFCVCICQTVVGWIRFYLHLHINPSHIIGKESCFRFILHIGLKFKLSLLYPSAIRVAVSYFSSLCAYAWVLRWKTALHPSCLLFIITKKFRIPSFVRMQC